MLKRHSTTDKPTHEAFDLEDSNNYPHLVDTLRMDDPLDIEMEFEQYKRHDIMFTSPQRKLIMVGQPTPLKHFPPGFTPYTPKAHSHDFDIHTTARKGLEEGLHQKLDFEESEQYEDNRGNTKTPSRNRAKRSEDFFDQTTIKRDYQEHLKLEFERPSRRRRETLLPDYVQTCQPKSFKGLRNLACNVKTVANKMGVATCKEIAESLIRQLEDEKEILPNSKQQQNIKRRVYDALKVLVAADIFQKQGKNIVTKQQEASQRVEESEYHQLKEKIVQTEKANDEKLQKLLILNNKLVVNEQLIQHNRAHPTPPSQRLYFPLVGVVTPEANFQYISCQQTTTSLSLQKSNFRLIGDIDMIMKMRVEEVARSPNQIKKDD